MKNFGYYYYHSEHYTPTEYDGEQRVTELAPEDVGRSAICEGCGQAIHCQ